MPLVSHVASAHRGVLGRPRIPIGRRHLLPCLVVAVAIMLTGCGQKPSSLSVAPGKAKVHGQISPMSMGNNSVLSGFGRVSVSPQKDVIPFTGKVQLIFFHPLVIYPTLAFHGSEAKGYQEWFITIKEFEAMLPQLYANNYILVNINSLYSLETVNGQTVVHQNVLWVPRGKKPLILSIDDLNYYTYMRENGNAYKLVLTKNGQIAAYSVDPSGHVVISRNDEIIPILDQFVAAHPDFSLDGAKGIINETGYQGVLGYRTEPGSPDRIQEIEAVLPVIAALKKDGWTFSSHSWGHRNDFKITYGDLVWDTQHWVTEVEPLVGPTDIYVYPFGATVRTGGHKMDFLISEGFHIFLGVGPHPAWVWGPNYVTANRVHIDGLALTTEPRMLAPFFNAASVLDYSARGLKQP